MYSERRKTDEGRIPDKLEKLIKKILALSTIVILCGLLVFALIFAFTMFYSVGVGHAAILVDPWAKTISDPILGPTWGVKAPWVEKVDVYYATDIFEDVIPCFSRDQLEMQIEVLIRWTLDPSKIKQLYTNYPRMNYKEKAIESIMEETIRLVTKNWTTVQTIELREVVVYAIENAVLKEIKEEISLSNALIHLEMDVKNIGYPEQYTTAIEAKLSAEQAKLQAEFERERIIILANATAQQFVIEATGAAEARVIEATAIKDAIELVLASVGQEGNSTRIAELYLVVYTLQRIAPYIDILIMAPDGTPILLPALQTLPTNSTVP